MGRRPRFPASHSFLLPAGLTAYLSIKGAWPHLPGLSCPLRAITGIPCPTCFLTRATAAALQGRFGESLALHGFGIPAAAALLAWSVLSLRRRRLLPITIQGPGLAMIAAALLGYWILRLVARYIYGLPAFPDG